MGPRRRELVSRYLYCEVGDLAASNIFFRPSIPDMASTFFLQSPTSTGRSYGGPHTHMLETKQAGGQLGALQAPEKLGEGKSASLTRGNPSTPAPRVRPKDRFGVDKGQTEVSLEEGSCVNWEFWMIAMGCRRQFPPW